jgi:hypothetical protein
LGGVGGWIFVFYCGNRDRDPLSQMRPQTGAEGGGAIHLSTPTTVARDHGGRRAARGRTRGAHTVVTPLYILLNVRGFNYIYDFALRLRPRNAHLTKVEKRTDTAAQPRPRAVPDPLIMSLSCWRPGSPPPPPPRAGARHHTAGAAPLHDTHAGL